MNKPRDGSGMYARGLRVPKPRRQITVRLPADLIDYAERDAYIRSAQPPYKEVTLSDVIRIALQHLRDTAAATVPADRDPCSHVQVSDMTFCSTCGLRWDTNDPCPPECPKKKVAP